MIRLIRSEALRLLSRRMLRGLALLAVAGIVLACVIAAINGHRPTASVVAAGFDDGRPRLADLPGILKGTSFILIAIGLVVGASSVGADWQQGTMATLLTWEPRRVRVFVVRLLTIAVVVTLLTVVLLALLSLGLALVASTRGSTVGTDDAWFRAVVGTILRISVVASLTAVLGAAIAGIGRHTAAAMGAVFVYLAVVESLLRGLVPRWVPNMLSSGMVVFIDGRAGDPGNGAVLSVERALATVVVYAVVFAVLATTLFRVRDVN